MSAVAVEIEEREEIAGGGGSAVLKQQVAERLAAHRAKRRKAGAETLGVVAREDGGTGAKARRIASVVAERYAQTQSYRAFLATEAEEATQKARAAAEVAARTAQAVAAAEQALLEELAQVDGRAESFAPDKGLEERTFVGEAAVEVWPSTVEVSRAGLSVRLFEDAGRRSREEYAEAGLRRTSEAATIEDSEETWALDEEISFRQSPTFELDRPSVAIPGNLLEFPRQLVAARKARPRYAEGPLQAGAAQDGAQLRIFEVEADQIASTPPVESSAPEWSSIWLDALAQEPVEVATEVVEAEAAIRLVVAPMERRVMAAIVDACLVGMGFVVFAAAFAYRAAILPSVGVAAIVSIGCLAMLFLVYQMIFFSFSEATPGMLYARIGLCTFADENPSRPAMQRRVLAVLLAGCPLGLGFLWAWVDDERLGWHDRMSRMYQRGY